MEIADHKTTVLLRCVKCHCPQPRPADGWCRACGWSAPIGRWEENTALRPVQPEERDGHRCRECGAEVMVTMPLARPVFYPWLPWIATGVILSGFAISASEWRVVGGFALLVALLSPLHVLFLRCGGGHVLSSIVVTCRGCSFVRVDGRSVEEVARPFRRGRALFDSLYRRLLAVFGFFLLVSVGAALLGTVPAWPSIAILVVSALALHSVRWYRGVFGLRSWW